MSNSGFTIKLEKSGSQEPVSIFRFLGMWWIIPLLGIALSFSLTILSSSRAIYYLHLLSRVRKGTMGFHNPISSPSFLGNPLRISDVQSSELRLIRAHKLWSNAGTRSYIALGLFTAVGGIGYSIGLGAPFWFPIALLLPFVCAPLISRSWSVE